MKYMIWSLCILGLLFLSCDNKVNGVTPEVKKNVEEIRFDSLLATRLNADPYGMHKYVMAFLKRGSNRDLDSLESQNLQRAHLDNIGKLAESGKLVLAGPFLDDGDLRGIYIFRVETVEEAEKLTRTDPAIQAGSLVMEMHPWYGSAALNEVNNIHKKLAKIEI